MSDHIYEYRERMKQGLIRVERQRQSSKDAGQEVIEITRKMFGDEMASKVEASLRRMA